MKTLHSSSILIRESWAGQVDAWVEDNKDKAVCACGKMAAECPCEHCGGDDQYKPGSEELREIAEGELA